MLYSWPRQAKPRINPAGVMAERTSREADAAARGAQAIKRRWANSASTAANSMRSGADPREEETPPVLEVPVSRAGDLWMRGTHRLVCGDATDAATVDRLLDGVKPHLMVTDPPFGVHYDPAWRTRAGASETKRTGRVLNGHRADWRETWALFPGEVAQVWHGALHATTVAESLVSQGFEIRSQIVWANDRHVLSRGHYHWQHEPCRPAGTMVWKVLERGAGSQSAEIVSVPIGTPSRGLRQATATSVSPHFSDRITA